MPKLRSKLGQNTGQLRVTRRKTTAPEELRRRIPRQDRAKLKVEKILEAARSLLETEGAGSLNTNRLAKEAGLSVGSVYEYFPNKEAITAELIEKLAEQEIETILRQLKKSADLPLGQQVDVLVREAFKLYKNSHALYRALAFLANQLRIHVGSRQSERIIMREVEAVLKSYAMDLVVTDFALAAYMVFHIVESMSFQAIVEAHRPCSEKLYVEEIATMVKRYLGLRQPRPARKK